MPTTRRTRLWHPFVRKQTNCTSACLVNYEIFRVKLDQSTLPFSRGVPCFRSDLATQELHNLEVILDTGVMKWGTTRHDGCKRQTVSMLTASEEATIRVVPVRCPQPDLSTTRRNWRWIQYLYLHECGSDLHFHKNRTPHWVDVVDGQGKPTVIKCYKPVNKPEQKPFIPRSLFAHRLPKPRRVASPRPGECEPWLREIPFRYTTTRKTLHCDVNFSWFMPLWNNPYHNFSFFSNQQAELLLRWLFVILSYSFKLVLHSLDPIHIFPFLLWLSNFLVSKGNNKCQEI